MKTIGIMGGTFNPIHYAHLRSAYEIKHKCMLDDLYLMPCANPPHREAPKVSQIDRLNMVKLCANTYNFFKVDDRELKREGPSYTLLSLQEIRTLNPDASLCLIIGSDSFNIFHTWHKYQEILNYCHLIINHRLHHKLDVTSAIAKLLNTHKTESPLDLKQSKFGKILPISTTNLEISGTFIRHELESGSWPCFLLPEKVLKYIKEHKLYMR